MDASNLPGWSHFWWRLRVGLVLGCAALAIALLAWPGGLLLVAFCMLPALPLVGAFALLSIGLAARAALAGDTSRFVREALLALGTVAIVAAPRIVLMPAVDLLQLAFFHATLDRAAAMLPPAAPRLVVLETDGFLDTASGLAWDGDDAILQPPGTQSQAWRDRAGGTPLESRCWSARRIVGHYVAWSGTHDCP